VVTGQSNILDGLSYFGSHSKEDIQSVGLVFEPNFFTAYFYADNEAKEMVALQEFDSTVPLLSHEIKSLKPLFALSFIGDFTIMPQQVFSEAEAGKYLAFNTSAGIDEAEWERVIGLEAVLVYKRDDRSERAVDTVFPGLKLKHGLGALLEFCRQNLTGENQIFLNQSGEIFQLVIFNQNGLVLANSITAGHAEDVRFYLLYSLKQLNMEGDPEITLLGSAAKNEPVISVLKPYFTSLSERKNKLKIVDRLAFPEISNPRLTAINWPGIYASLCAL